AGVAGTDHAGKLDAVHAGHDDVGEDEVGGKLVFGKDRERRIGIGDPPGRVTEVFQQLHGELPDLVVVFDDEHAIAATRGRRIAARGGSFHFTGGGGGPRAIDREGRALFRAAGALVFA